MMTIVRHITIDPCGRVYEVTNLFDRFGNDTNDPALTHSCVIKLDDDRWMPQDADDIPIYTVH